MTQEEKFKEAKRLYETANADQRYVLESLFPELRESEDERIRKALIKFFTLSDDNADYQCCGVHYKDIVAWLERQEQKSAWSEEDEEMLKMVIKSCEQCGNEYAYYWLKSIKDRVQPQPQSQWKPSAEQMDALLYVVRNYTPGVTERIAWESIKTLELMFKDLKKLKD